MMSEEQFHVQFLKEKANSLGLTFDLYMLFLIFETLEHASVLEQGVDSSVPTEWEEAYRNQQKNEQ